MKIGKQILIYRKINKKVHYNIKKINNYKKALYNNQINQYLIQIIN